MYLVFIDTETHAKDSPIVLQLGAIIVSQDGEISSIDEMFNIGDTHIEFEAMSVHHITKEMLVGKSKFIESAAFSELQKYNSKENFLIAHNASFDVEALKNSGFDNKMTVIDTYRCAQHLFPDYEKYKLQYLRYALGLYKSEDAEIKRLGINIDNTVAHSALPDALYLKMFFDHLLKSVVEIDKLVHLTNTVVRLKYMPLGKYSKYKMSEPPTIAELAITDPSYLHYMRKLSNITEELAYTIDHYLNKRR